MHPRGGIGDAVIFTMAHYPKRETLDSHEFSFMGGQRLFGHFTRPYGDAPHTTVVGPVSIEIVEPYKTVRLTADPAVAPVGVDVTFTARTQAYALRRGTMKAGDEIIWDQSHFLQSGTYSGSYTYNGVTRSVDDWWGQRDHSWGIRDHARCPMWLWLAIQLPDGMFGVWHWEYANGARLHRWLLRASGRRRADPDHRLPPRPALDRQERRADRLRPGTAATPPALQAASSSCWRADARSRSMGKRTRCASYGPYGGGQHQMLVRSDDGRTGTAIYELTGSHHHRYFPIARAEHLPPG